MILTNHFLFNLTQLNSNQNQIRLSKYWIEIFFGFNCLWFFTLIFRRQSYASKLKLYRKHNYIKNTIALKMDCHNYWTYTDKAFALKHKWIKIKFKHSWSEIRVVSKMQLQQKPNVIKFRIAHFMQMDKTKNVIA